MRFAANISTLFTELPFLERFSAAREAGFSGIECWYLDDYPLAEVKAALKDCGLPLVVFNMPRSGKAGQEWGCAALPGAQADFNSAFERAAEMAAELNAYGIHVMAGMVQNSAREEAETVFKANLRHAVDRVGDDGPLLLIEPINSRDVPGYFLGSSDQAAALLRALQCRRLKLMFDVYHIQIADGDLTRRLHTYQDIVGHVQIAAVPDRGEPDRGEINFLSLFSELRACEYRSWIGCEYRPRNSTLEGLDWLTKF